MAAGGYYSVYAKLLLVERAFNKNNMTKRNITTTEITSTDTLKHIFQFNIIWDLGFQMTHLQNHPQNFNYSNHGLCQKCFFPCSNVMKPWRHHFKTNDIFCPEIYNCRSKGVLNTHSSFIHFS